MHGIHVLEELEKDLDFELEKVERYDDVHIAQKECDGDDL